MSNSNETVFALLTTLPTVTEQAADILRTTLSIKSVADLAESHHFAFASEILEAASNPSHALRRFGIPHGRIAKGFENKSIEELADAPLRALEGIDEQRDRELVKALGVKTVSELGKWPPFLRAREILDEAVRKGFVSGDPKISRVSGLVVRSDGTPIAGASVKIERQGIRKTTPLGNIDTVKTNTNGGYIFEYERPPTPNSNGALTARIDLRVQLVADPNNNIGETRPRIITRAGPDERVDFVVGDEKFRGRSTFERLEDVVIEALADEGIKPAEIVDFDEEALARLALKAGIEPVTLVLLRQSYVLAKETELPAEVFFGMGREKMPLGLSALLVQDPDKRRAAVKAALAANHIPARLEKETARVLATLDELTVAEALKKPTSPDKTTLGALLDGMNLSAAKQKRLAETYAKHPGTNEEFWKEVQSTGVLTDAEVKQVQFTLQLAVAAQNHAPLVKALKARAISELKGLAALSKAELIGLIKGENGGQPVGLPADLKAAGLNEEGYADLIFCVIEDAFPTAMVAHHIESLSDSVPLKTFFERNPEFDLRTTPVRSYLERNANALDFIASDSERKAVEKRLKSLERIYKISPAGSRVETMQVLSKERFTSAEGICRTGKAAFMRRLTPPLGQERAEKVWARANNASALASILVARHSALFDRTPMYVMPKRVEKLSTFSSYESMFGSLDFCSCEHCRSVFSPAAYLVDILHWLDNRVADGKTALDVLFENRRADIGAIALSCANTNTPLPYIDIVNEALELSVAPVSPTPTYRTTGSPADLLAHPEHLHKGAYEVLAGAKAGSPGGADAIYPVNLPFNLWVKEARTYLGQLGVSRYALMEAFLGDTLARPDAEDSDEERRRTREAFSAETLGMSPLEWDVIAGKDLGAERTVAAFWGLSGDADFLTKLENVSFLLERATPPIAENGMEFEELADILRTDFVQNAVTVGVWFDGQTCDTTKARLIGLTEPSLDRIHRFIRLRRRLGWSTLDLDRAIQVLGAGKLDENCLISISYLRRLSGQLHLPVAELLGLDMRRWRIRLKRGIPTGAPSGIEGFGMVFDNVLTPQPEDGNDASPYDRLFQTASASAEPNPIFGVAPGGATLVDESENLVSHVPAIAGALGITAEDLTELLPRLANSNLTLENLSALYRHVFFARALNLNIRDFRSLLELTGINPFDPARPEKALAFIEEVDAIRQSGLSISELDYLLRHRDTKPATLEPDEIEIGVLFFELGDALRKIEVDHPTPATVIELRARLETELPLILTTADAAGALAIIDVDVTAGAAVPADAETIIDEKLKGIFDPVDARKKLVDQSDAEFLSKLEDRFKYALSVIVAHLTASTVIEKMASAAGIDTALAAPLLREYLKHPDATGRPLLAVFSDDAVRNHQVTIEGTDEPVLPTSGDLPDQFAGFKRLQKAAILKRLRISKEELQWVLESGPARGTLDFQDLPVAPDATAAPYSGWVQLRDAVAVRDSFSPRELFRLLEAAAAAQADGTDAAKTAAHEAFLAELERRSRWEKTDIEFLVGTPTRIAGDPPVTTAAVPGALGFRYPEDWQDAKPFMRLAEVMAIVRRLALPAPTPWQWRDIPMPPDGTPAAQQAAIEQQAAQASEIKQAVRARFENGRWYEVARTLRDRLREQQRNALVGWLVGNDPRFRDASALFDHLLLDVEMSPCQLTSRIKQAISSVQLFIQRVLMSLEVDDSGAPLVEFSREDADEWDWMKVYRIWEANRKVFLYPENWIEPELRDNKTPFFKELEDELLQSEVTAESAERAVRGYLEKLDQVARLEISGFFHQKDDGADILNVFGRTRGTPPIYFYRQRVNKSYWTPWEKVDLDIEGDHLIPFVFNRRLYIFCPWITESALEEAPPQIPADGTPTPSNPKRYYEIRLAWSEHRDKGWSPKKIAKQFIGEDVKDFITDDIFKTAESTPADFFFLAQEVKVDQGTDLVIQPIRYYRSAQIARVLYRREKGEGGGPIETEASEEDEEDEEDDNDENPPAPSTDPRVILPGYYLLPRFRMSGCDGTITLEKQDRAGDRVIVSTPNTVEVVNQSFARTTGNDPLVLPSRDLVIPEKIDPEETLKTPHAPFEIVPLRLNNFQSRDPFFYQDRRCTFFVEPRITHRPVRRVREWTIGANIPLDAQRILPELCQRPEPPPINPWIYDPTAVVRQPESISFTRAAVAPRSSGTQPRLLPLAHGAALETFGPTVTFVGGEPVLSGSSNIALRGIARIVNANGRELAVMRTGMPSTIPGELGTLFIRSRLVLPGLTVGDIAAGSLLKPWQATRYRFDSFYHPYLCTIMRELNRFGLPGIYDPREPLLLRQEKREDFFAAEYGPNAVIKPFPKDEFDFSFGGAYAIYNWELFFHVPFTIACHLSRNHRFAEAQKWFHYIFDPTETDGQAPQRFWKFNPLFALFKDAATESGPIHELLLLLQYDGSESEKLRARDEIIDQVAEWRANPFNPHALARLRLGAYARSVVMKYIDNLIDWGDQLFRRDTMESINEATQLYMLAFQMLGRRPRIVNVESPDPSTTFNDLRGDLDAFSNALVEEVEGFLPEVTDTTSDIYADDVAVMGPTLFFCVPPNEKLLTDYWDRVADRLFKIRHCMNIEGVLRQLPLFEPPLDPALLVRARAAGVDLASALLDLNAPVPFYRYQVLAQKATELCADVRSLGQALLSALEKKDAEAFALLRAGHEVKLQQAMLDIRDKQIDEAKETLESLKRSKENAEIRRDFYGSRQFLNVAEALQFTFSTAAAVLDFSAVVARSLGTVLPATIPDVTFGSAGFGGSPVFNLTYGGTKAYLSTESTAEGLRTAAGLSDRAAQLAGMIGGYERRQEEWNLQRDTAAKEIEALDRQIVAAEIRVAIAEKELDNLKLQLEQSKEAEEFLREKYTNDQLYHWMVGQLSSIYFQSYQLAYDMAKRAERAWRFELGVSDDSLQNKLVFIQFGYWDGLKKGLLAGEKLHYDLKRMESAYLDQNKREFELTKHISLAMLNPTELLRLKETGTCSFTLPEVIFDLDHPGHYMRRIKAVSLTIPCVVGPYTGVNASLTLLTSRIRIKTDTASGLTDTRFGVQSIATSSAQQDPGLFEMRFGDERYLPFEGAGVVSDWRLELPKEFRQFDFDSISDVIFHLQYTARDGGTPFKDAVELELKQSLNQLAVFLASSETGLTRIVSMAAEFGSDWHRFINPPAAAEAQELKLTLDKRLFPFMLKDRPLDIREIAIILLLKNPTVYSGVSNLPLTFTPAGGTATTGDLTLLPALGGQPSLVVSTNFTLEQDTKEIAVRIDEANVGSLAPSLIEVREGKNRLNREQVKDMLFVLNHTVSGED